MHRPLKGSSDGGENDVHEDDGESQKRALLSSSDTAETKTVAANSCHDRSGSDDKTHEGTDEHDHRATIMPHPALTYLRRHADFILMPILPILLCLLLVTTMNRDQLLSAWFMPLLRIFSATLANAVPVGGGVVFVPVLHLLGYHITLGSAFAVSTMTFGNGIGFLTWLKKDPSAIVFYALPAAVIPAWIGSAIGTLRPLMSAEQCRTIFALFAIKVAVIVWRGICREAKLECGQTVYHWVLRKRCRGSRSRETKEKYTIYSFGVQLLFWIDIGQSHRDW